MITVVARWQTAEGKHGDVLALAAALRARSLEEPGCLGYELLVADAPGAVFLIERYRDDAALAAHRESAHYRELLVGTILPLVTDRRVEVLRDAGQCA